MALLFFKIFCVKINALLHAFDLIVEALFPFRLRYFITKIQSELIVTLQLAHVERHWKSTYENICNLIPFLDQDECFKCLLTIQIALVCQYVLITFTIKYVIHILHWLCQIWHIHISVAISQDLCCNPCIWHAFKLHVESILLLTF